MTTKACPYTTATAKLYFVNLLRSRKESFTSFNEAIYEETQLCLIADKLKYEQLTVLIDKIESKL